MVDGRNSLIFFIKKKNVKVLCFKFIQHVHLTISTDFLVPLQFFIVKIMMKLTLLKAKDLENIISNMNLLLTNEYVLLKFNKFAN